MHRRRQTDPDAALSQGTQAVQSLGVQLVADRVVHELQDARSHALDRLIHKVAVATAPLKSGQCTAAGRHTIGAGIYTGTTLISTQYTHIRSQRIGRVLNRGADTGVKVQVQVHPRARWTEARETYRASMSLKFWTGLMEPTSLTPVEIMFCSRVSEPQVHVPARGIGTRVAATERHGHQSRASPAW